MATARDAFVNQARACAGLVDKRPRAVVSTASSALCDLLLGPPRAARVLAVFPTAVYVLVDGDVVVALVTSDGVRLPNAVVVSASSEELPFGAVMVGDPVQLGDGVVSTGSCVLAVARWFDPHPRVGVVQLGLASRVAGLEGSLGPDPHAGTPWARPLRVGMASLAEAIDCRDAAAVAAVVPGLVGLGPGLTPAGDDVLAGVITAGHLLGSGSGTRALLSGFRQAVLTHRRRTTALAATLADHAARGEVAEPVGAVCRALAGKAPLQPALSRLLAVGHTSGRDLAVGLALGARLAGTTP